jgi:hypothetical protein
MTIIRRIVNHCSSSVVAATVKFGFRADNETPGGVFIRPPRDHRSLFHE